MAAERREGGGTTPLDVALGLGAGGPGRDLLGSTPLGSLPLRSALFAVGGVGVSGKRSGHCSGGRCSNCWNLELKDLFTVAGLDWN